MRERAKTKTKCSEINESILTREEKNWPPKCSEVLSEKDCSPV